jgi:hypothetical protein
MGRKGVRGNSNSGRRLGKPGLEEEASFFLHFRITQLLYFSFQNDHLVLFMLMIVPWQANKKAVTWSFTLSRLFLFSSKSFFMAAN